MKHKIKKLGENPYFWQFEIYFLRLLLLHVPSATSFENLRTFDNITYATFLEAAVARNLDDEWERCLEEACSNQFPNALCKLFTFICIFQNLINIKYLWNKFKTHSYHPNMHETQGETALNLHGTCLSNFDLPSVLTIMMEIGNNISNDMDTSQMPENNIYNTLSSRQKYVFDKIIQALENTEAHR